MKHLWDRLNSPTPAFWRKVRGVGIVAGAIGTPMAAAADILPAWIAVAGNYLVVASGVTIALASLTCTDTPTNQIQLTVQGGLLTELNRPAVPADQSTI